MPMPCKVLMLVENISVPADPRVWREACTLRSCGYQVSIICPKGETRDNETYICIEGIHIYRYRLSMTTNKSSDYIKEYSKAMLMTFLLSFRVLFRHGFDVIHAANPPDTFFVLGLFYKLLRKKYVFDQHDLAPEIFHIKFQNKMKFLHKVLLVLEQLSYRTADVVITTNELQKQVAMKRGGCVEKKVFVVRNGPDLTRFAEVTYEPVLKQGKEFLLAYVGVMSAQDGVELVLYALHELIHVRQRQDVSLVLMGDGEQLPRLKAITQQLDLEDVVHFAGWVGKSDMLRYLAVTDIGLSPDPSNELNDHSTMLKTMEYMAMGKPVVAFDLPETRFSAQNAGLYAQPNKVTSFTDMIETLLNDKALRLQMGGVGRKRVEEALSWEHTKVNLILAYDSLFPQIATPGLREVEEATPTLASY